MIRPIRRLAAWWTRMWWGNVSPGNMVATPPTWRTFLARVWEACGGTGKRWRRE